MEITSMNLYIICVIYLLLRFYRLSVPVTSCILQESSFSFKMFDQRFLSQLIQNDSLTPLQKFKSNGIFSHFWKEKIFKILLWQASMPSLSVLFRFGQGWQQIISL